MRKTWAAVVPLPQTGCGYKLSLLRPIYLCSSLLLWFISTELNQSFWTFGEIFRMKWNLWILSTGKKKKKVLITNAQSFCTQSQVSKSFWTRRQPVLIFYDFCYHGGDCRGRGKERDVHILVHLMKICFLHEWVGQKDNFHKP